jgi:hypothetical protein
MPQNWWRVCRRTEALLTGDGASKRGIRRRCSEKNVRRHWQGLTRASTPPMTARHSTQARLLSSTASRRERNLYNAQEAQCLSSEGPRYAEARPVDGPHRVPGRSGVTASGEECTRGGSSRPHGGRDGGRREEGGCGPRAFCVGRLRGRPGETSPICISKNVRVRSGLRGLAGEDCVGRAAAQRPPWRSSARRSRRGPVSWRVCGAVHG